MPGQYFLELFVNAQVYSNTVPNWRAVDVTLGRQLKTILYLTNDSVHDQLATLARDHGWMVFETPRVSPSGVPYLKDMYHHASQNLTGCIFYGFSNGDILYNRDLLVTLNAIFPVPDITYNVFGGTLKLTQLECHL